MDTEQKNQTKNGWEEIPGTKVKRRPMLPIQKFAAWVLVGPMILFWVYFLFQFFTTRKSDGALVIILVSFPALLLLIVGINLFFSRRAIKKLDAMSSELGLESFCYMGAPLWMVNYPHFRGFRNGHGVGIDFESRKQTFTVTLTIRGSEVDRITDASFMQILGEQKMQLARFDRGAGLITIAVREHLFWDQTQKWLTATLSLLEKRN